MTVTREELPYRDCVGIALFNRSGEVFIGRRIPSGDPEDSLEHGSPWQMPQGGIDKGETAEAAARRELYEETSIESVAELATIEDWLYYDLPEDMIGIGLKGKYRGQRQRWLAYVFTGDEAEIDVRAPGGGKHHAEFDHWRWEMLDRLPDLIVPFKRDVYRQVCAQFAGLPQRVREQGW